MTQRRRRIRFALTAMIEALIEPGLTTGLAKPIAGLEQFQNTSP
jgi:hypothetical protein